ncbi:hypothetical protein ACJ73_08838 [Blastomyces percursus]|uniref:Uncharacterized protein n=1 Tax=Blastomyces percursus TaxID=1658174 RepID=A0A1J9PLH8_9EURO|nr:hypothetical protein ACJ73_08838 [Blastomyces percursus]
MWMSPTSLEGETLLDVFWTPTSNPIGLTRSLRPFATRDTV